MPVSPPSLKAVSPEDYDDMPESFREKFLATLNPFLRDCVVALESLLSKPKEDRDVAFSTGASVAHNTTPFPLTIVPQFARRPTSVVVINPVLTGGAVPIAAVQPFWELDGAGNVVIRLFTGLDASSAYRIRLRLE